MYISSTSSNNLLYYWKLQGFKNTSVKACLASLSTEINETVLHGRIEIFGYVSKFYCGYYWLIFGERKMKIENWLPNHDSRSANANPEM